MAVATLFSQTATAIETIAALRAAGLLLILMLLNRKGKQAATSDYEIRNDTPNFDGTGTGTIY